MINGTINTIQQLWIKEYKYTTISRNAADPINLEMIDNVLDRHCLERKLEKSLIVNEFNKYINIKLIFFFFLFK